MVQRIIKNYTAKDHYKLTKRQKQQKQKQQQQ